MFPQATAFDNFESVMMQDQMSKMMLGPRFGQRGMAEMAMPRMDVYQRVDDGAIVCWVELAGMKKDHVEVNLIDDRLVITGRKPRHAHECSADEDEKMISFCNERNYGAFVREVKVPRGLDEKDVKANMEHGLLKVVVPGRKEHCHCSVKVE